MRRRMCDLPSYRASRSSPHTPLHPQTLLNPSRGCASNDLYAFSTLDLSHFSTTLLQTSGEVPTPRAGHGAALIGTTTLLICGGIKYFSDQNVLNDDSLYLLNLGTSDLLIQVRHQLIIALRSSIARVEPRCGQWSRTGRSPQPKLPNHNRGR